MLVATTFAKWYKLTPVRLAVLLTVLGAVTWVREYFLHWQRVWDDVVAVDVIDEVAGAMMSWLGDWFGLILAVALPLLAGTILLARAGHLGWLGRWASGQLYVRGYDREAD